jgi:hypothetical protein
MVCGLSVGLRAVHGEELHHRVSVNIIDGSGIHLDHDRLGSGISTGQNLVLPLVLPGLRDPQPCPRMTSSV